MNNFDFLTILDFKLGFGKLLLIFIYRRLTNVLHSQALPMTNCFLVSQQKFLTIVVIVQNYAEMLSFVCHRNRGRETELLMIIMMN